MTQYTTRQSVLFPDLFPKPVVATFDQPDSSSDGGAILLKAADRGLGLVEALAKQLVDSRQPGKVHHELVELLAQRIFAIACGYPDCNDAGQIGDDPIQKLLVGRDPVDGERLGSQSTLSRFENAHGRRSLYRMGAALADAVVERHRVRRRGRAKQITIDLDSTDVETHGEQQLTFFNGFYREWCYLPLVGWLTFDQEPEQYAFSAVLRPGNAPNKRGVLGILRRILARVRQAFPRARLRVRLDAGFACPELFAFLEQEDVEYVVAIAVNDALRPEVEEMMAEVRERSARSGMTETYYGDCFYRAGTWPHPRRVVYKAEVVRLAGREPRDNPRFVVTNLAGSPDEIYAIDYCGRGDSENRIKEMKELRIDRTSCSAFLANQFRVLLALAAYVLMQEVRARAARTALARAQVGTLRERLFKLAAWANSTTRRIVLHLPQGYPWLRIWRRVAVALGACPG